MREEACGEAPVGAARAEADGLAWEREAAEVRGREVAAAGVAARGEAVGED